MKFFQICGIVLGALFVVAFLSVVFVYTVEAVSADERAELKQLLREADLNNRQTAAILTRLEANEDSERERLELEKKKWPKLTRAK